MQPSAEPSASSEQLTSAEQWPTLDDLVAARERFAAAIPGWRWPAAHGVGLIPSGAEPAPVHFPLTNTDHKLPGVALATVLGHRSGTAVLDLDRAQLEAAIALLRPAEACPVPHPNLWTWRDRYLPALDADPGARLVAVYLGDLDDPIGGPEHAAFRAALTSRATA
jgi:hypothetical protein